MAIAQGCVGLLGGCVGASGVGCASMRVCISERYRACWCAGCLCRVELHETKRELGYI